MKTRSFLFLITMLLSACGSFGTNTAATNLPDGDPRKFPQITDVNRYSEVMNSITPVIVVEHFPKNIPAEATNVKFAYQPRFMQGAMFLELLITLPESQVDEVWNKYSGLEQYEHSEEKSITDIPEPILYLISDENYGFDQNFSIFLISAEPAGKEDFIWNHGTMYGVGINKTTFQVIYWLQYW